jgi:hypothetical protein
MGVYYKFANLTDKEIIDGHSAKLGEWKSNGFDQALIINYLANMCSEFKEVKFIADESGEWNLYNEETGFTDVTADVLYSMFEDLYFNYHEIGEYTIKWIFRKFKEADRLDDFEKMCKELPKFEEAKINIALEELEK